VQNAKSRQRNLLDRAKLNHREIWLPPSGVNSTNSKPCSPLLMHVETAIPALKPLRST
jgi:hypothetical protein